MTRSTDEIPLLDGFEIISTYENIYASCEGRYATWEEEIETENVECDVNEVPEIPEEVYHSPSTDLFQCGTSEDVVDSSSQVRGLLNIRIREISSKVMHPQDNENTQTHSYKCIIV